MSESSLWNPPFQGAPRGHPCDFTLTKSPASRIPIKAQLLTPLYPDHFNLASYSLGELDADKCPCFLLSLGGGAGEEAGSLEAALGLTSAGETETERLIRLGEMTPFGTAMTNVTNASAAKAKTSGAKPSTSNQVSAFEKYLIDQSKLSVVKKKTTTQKRKPSSTITASASSAQLENDESGSSAKKAKLVASKSTPDLKSATKSNRFDAKDKRRYVSAEKDFSSHKQSSRRFRVKHEWSGDPDPDVSDDAGEDASGDDDAEWRPSRDDVIDDDENDDEGDFHFLSDALPTQGV